MGAERLVGNLGKFQNMFKDDARYELHPDEIAKAFASLSDIPMANKFVTAVPGAMSPQEMMRQEKEREHEMQLEEQAAAQQIEQPEEPVPNFVGGTMMRDPLVTAAAEHLDKL